MRHLAVLGSVAVVALAVLLGLGRVAPAAVAQEATPAAAPNLTIGQLAPIGQPFEVVPGVTLELLNEGPAAQAPGHTVVLYRVTLAPGAEVPTHIHPGATLLTVEEGPFAWTLVSGTVRVTRPGAATEQVTAPGTELLLNAGEGLSYDAEVIHTARGAGDGPTSVLVASVFVTGQPLITPTNELGTPAPM